MRPFAIVLLVISLTAGAALAQGGHIGLYSDFPGYSSCNLSETLYATNTIYVVHTLAATGNTAQFKIVNGWQGPIAGAISWGTNLFLGDPYTGIVVTYVGCKALPYLLGTLSFIPLSPTPTCSAWFWIVADPEVASGHVEVVDCNSHVLLATGGALSVNGSLQCVCWEPPPVSAEETSWGKVKALYQ